MQKKTALYKMIWREITSSKARFFSILFLILLGVGFFSGLQATGPNMLKTANDYFDRQNLYDLHIQSNYGLDEEEYTLLKEEEAIQVVEGHYSSDVLFGEDRLVIKLIGYDDTNQLNQFRVDAGRLPEKVNEIALDYNDIMTSQYAIGDVVTIYSGKQDANLSDTVLESTYTVVGFVTSPRYITNDSRGQTTLGRGQLDAFGVVQADVFTLDVYTDIFVTFKASENLSMYSDTYIEQMNDYKDAYEPALEKVGGSRLDQITLDAREEIDDGQTEIEEAKQELVDAEKELAEAKEELETGEAEIRSAEAELEDAFLELDREEQNYRDGVETFEEEMKKAEERLANENKTLEESEQQVKDGLREIEAGLNQLNEPYADLVTQETALLDQRDDIRQLNQQLSELFQTPIDLLTDEMRQAWIDETSEVTFNDTSLSTLLQGYFNGTVTQEKVSTFIASADAGLTAGISELRTNINEVNAKRNELEAEQQALKGSLDDINAGKAALEDARKQLNNQRTETEQELADGRRQLDRGWSEYDQGVRELEEAKEALAEGQADYEEGVKTFNKEKQDAEREIKEAEQELTEALAELDTLAAPTYYLSVRHDNGQLVEFENNAERMSDLATIFPVVFFLIAALVTLTTVTRMIEEQRVEMGTLKALGYTDRDIQKKYYWYALSATLVGAILGLVLGYTLLPKVIFNAYQILYNLPPLALDFYWSFTLISLAVALFSSIVTAWYVLRKDLKTTPAILMRPKAPKNGKRILIERITPVWRRMNFMQKVTARNLFRYKQRMLMTVIGISGCAALIITGFGLKSAVEGIVDLQFGRVMNYEAVVALDSEATETEKQAYRAIIDKMDTIEASLMVYQETLDANKAGVAPQDVTLFVPETPGVLDQFVQLKSRTTDEAFNLEENGAIITEKLATLFEVEKGDDFTLSTADDEVLTVTVGGIIENYAGHYLYLSPDVYEAALNKTPEYNAELLKYPYSEAFEAKLSEELSVSDYVITTSYNESMLNLFKDSMESLNIVVVVLIVAAAGLAFIVLYNLTNINVSERIRELSTIKVLGFYDKEVTMYIYRENIILTIMGIVVGGLFGRLLHIFILDTASMDNMMFNPSLSWTSYVYAAILTMIFSTMVMVMMHQKLKHVDMIEALKSNE
ncbi:ABC transporter permease [Halolactibacillus alkaliphilus]|uniref:ABC transporter permease n=1 Tax=Halolactibacillus alkaliphilus TaxID=442899 RepID=A0A511X420_9BACI|nr:FtsX-like permease family protein [Halolactibacillus alkaliphilus]GEN57696.1 ABC transporter permease [Halolactibacillus alkaliphilus]GGN74872.1 ABC transporter permease [Halolactibacillus alkaliphilus]SFP03677.1 putative ABC transport system permease protein [Halolactibacillus alkaliphilus]